MSSDNADTISEVGDQHEVTETAEGDTDAENLSVESLENELEQLIDDLGEEFGAELDQAETATDSTANEEVAAIESERDNPVSDSPESADDEDDEITLDFDGEFDLSTDISEENKKQSNS